MEIAFIILIVVWAILLFLWFVNLIFLIKEECDDYEET